MGIGAASAQSVLTDQFRLVQAGLSVSVVEDLGNPPCASWNSFLCSASRFNDVTRSFGSGTDANGGFYQLSFVTVPRTDPLLCPARDGTVAEVFNIELVKEGSVTLIARVPTCVMIDATPDSPRQFTVLHNLASDSVNGYLYVAVQSYVSPPDSNYRGGIVRISGFPTVLDELPAGPPGPQGPQGPQGPPGTPADPAQVLALQQQVAALQGQVNALQLTLQQIENLPTIRRLLEKVQQLEQVAVP